MHMRRQKRHSTYLPIDLHLHTKFRNSPKTSFQKTLFFTNVYSTVIHIHCKLLATCKLPENVENHTSYTALVQNKSIHHRPHIPHEFEAEFIPSQIHPVRWLGTNRCISIHSRQHYTRWIAPRVPVALTFQGGDSVEDTNGDFAGLIGVFHVVQTSMGSQQLKEQLSAANSVAVAPTPLSVPAG